MSAAKQPTAGRPDRQGRFEQAPQRAYRPARRPTARQAADSRRTTSAPEELQEILVELLLVEAGDAVRRARVHLQRGIFDQLRRPRRRSGACLAVRAPASAFYCSSV